MESLSNTQQTFPNQISYYTIIKKLGEGGMGEVYLAEDNRLGRQVAIKFLPKELAQDKEHLNRFRQEAKVISILNHPNIISIFDVGETDFGSFIVMELITGQTLREYYDQLPNYQLITELGEQIAGALSVAHERHIVHRDIKPENIMVRNDGYVKLLDFGLARFTQSNYSNGTMVKTQTGVILGTVTHMSPEQTQASFLTPATDIFSLGIIFYELATGINPFEANSMVGYLHKINSQEPIKPSKLNPELPKKLESLILRMLEKDPCLRPSAKEIAQTLNTNIKDVTKPLPSLISLGIKEPETQIAIAIANIKGLIGREKETKTLSEILEKTLNGTSSLVSIIGEAGMGKTSLVESFLLNLKNNKQIVVAQGHSSERLAGTEAYLPFLESLSNLLNGVYCEAASQLMKNFAPSWYLQLVPNANNSTINQQLLEIKALSQEKMKLEIVSFLQHFSEQKTLVLLFEDFHWADISTIDLLNYLASLKFASLKVLFVVTYRLSEMLKAKHPFLLTKTHLQKNNLHKEISLNFLTEANIKEYLDLKFPNNTFQKEFAILLQNKTQGNPLFIKELVQYLLDLNVISLISESWSLTQPIEEMEFKLPESIRSLIDKKLEQLSEVDQKLLTIGSVQGNEFDSAIIAKVLNLDPADVEEQLEYIAKTYFLIELVKESEFPDHTLTSCYKFVHLLYQNVFYQNLKPSRRLSLANSIATALEEFYANNPQIIASQLANLYETGRKFLKSSDYYLMAAKNAAKLFANQEVIALARKGLVQTGFLTEEEKLNRQLNLHLVLGFALSVVKGYAAKETGESFNKAHEICQTLSNTSKLFPIVWGLELYYTVKAQYQMSYNYTELLLQIAKTNQNSMELLAAHYSFGVTLHFLGDLTRAHKHLQKATSLHEAEKTHVYSMVYSLDPGFYSRCVLIRSFLIMGYTDQAYGQLNETLALVKKSSHPRNLIRVQMSATIFYQFIKDPVKTQHWAEECLSECIKHGIRQEQEWMEVIQGWAIAAQGNFELGTSKMMERMSKLKLESECTFSTFYALLAELFYQNDKISQGLEIISQALEMINRTNERFYLAEIYRIKGNLLFKQAQAFALNDLILEAEISIRESIKIAQSQQAKAWELRSCIDLVLILDKTEKLQQALKNLQNIYQQFTEGHTSTDLIFAKQLLFKNNNLQK